MFYQKITLEDGQTIDIPFNEDNIYTKCQECGKEVLIEYGLLAEIIEEDGTGNVRITCDECVDRRNKCETEEGPINAAEVLAVSIAEMIDKKFQPLKQEVAELKRRAQQLGSEN